MAGAVTAQEPGPLSDEQIRQLIEQKLQAKKLLKDSFDVSVETGVVTLSGKVPNIWTKEWIIAIALDVPQTQEVLSELAIATGESDEDLAQQLGEKIRRYPSYTIHDEVTGRVEDGVGVRGYAGLERESVRTGPNPLQELAGIVVLPSAPDL